MSISTISRDVDSYDTLSEEVSLEQHGFADEDAVQAGKALERYPFCGRHELAFKSYPRPVGGSPVTTTTPAGGG